MFVAFFTGRALDPNDVTPGVDDCVSVLGGSANAKAREVLAAALRQSRDDGAAEVGGFDSGGSGARNLTKRTDRYKSLFRSNISITAIFFFSFLIFSFFQIKG